MTQTIKKSHGSTERTFRFSDMSIFSSFSSRDDLCPFFGIFTICKFLEDCKSRPQSKAQKSVASPFHSIATFGTRSALGSLIKPMNLNDACPAHQICSHSRSNPPSGNCRKVIILKNHCRCSLRRPSALCDRCPMLTPPLTRRTPRHRRHCHAPSMQFAIH